MNTSGSLPGFARANPFKHTRCELIHFERLNSGGKRMTKHKIVVALFITAGLTGIAYAFISTSHAWANQSITKQQQHFQMTPATATFTVTNTNSEGAGSFRDALFKANQSPGSVITFNIASGHTINVVAELPTITVPLRIDGTTQPGYAGTPIVELNGATATNPLSGLIRISGGSSVIRGLVINRNRDNGIKLGGGGGNIIENNFIGTDVAGTSKLGNAADGISIEGLQAIPCVEMSFREMASPASIISSSGNIVQGNWIGTDKSGSGLAIANATGIAIFGGPNTIGGEGAGAGNTIAFNSNHWRVG